MTISLSWYFSTLRITHDDCIIAELNQDPIDTEQPTDVFDHIRLLDFIDDTIESYGLSYDMMDNDSIILVQSMRNYVGIYTPRAKVMSYSIRHDSVVIWSNVDYRPGREFCILEMDVYKRHTIVEVSKRIVMNPTVTPSGLKVFKVPIRHGPLKDCVPFVYKVQVYDRTTLMCETKGVIRC